MEKYSSQDLINNVNNVSHALLALGLTDKQQKLLLFQITVLNGIL